MKLKNRTEGSQTRTERRPPSSTLIFSIRTQYKRLLQNNHELRYSERDVKGKHSEEAPPPPQTAPGEAEGPHLVAPAHRAVVEAKEVYELIQELADADGGDVS